MSFAAIKVLRYLSLGKYSQKLFDLSDHFRNPFEKSSDEKNLGAVVDKL